MKGSGVTKGRQGNYFEDFKLGQVIQHATPRTVSAGDVSLYTALYGSRFAVQSSDAFAQAIGYPQSPVDDLLVFHIVFGKTVPDISLNAIAKSWLRGMRVPQTGLPRRNSVLVFGSDRATRELQQRERRRLRAHDGARPAWRTGSQLCSLGDGQKAQQRGAGAGSSCAEAEKRGHAGGAWGCGTAARPRRRTTPL